MVRPYNILANSITFVVCVTMIASLVVFELVDKEKLFTLDSPMVYAFLVTIVLVILFIINAAQELKRRKQAAAKASDGSAELFRELRLVGFYTVGLLLYIWLLKYLHFLIGSLIFVALGMFALNSTNAGIGKKVLWAGGATLITVPLLYGVFSIIFSVILP